MSAILSVYVIIGVGYLIGRYLNLEPKTLARASLYVFTPALILKSLVYATTPLEDMLALAVLYMTIFCFVWGFGLILAKLIKLPTHTRNAFLLGAIFPNNGNYGLPMILFAYGQSAFERGVVCVIIMALLLNSVGIYIASSGDNCSTRRAFLNVFKMPAIYAFAIGVIMYLVQWHPGEQLMKPVLLLGDAAIPTEMLVLGIQLAKVRKAVISYRTVIWATLTKLALAPLIAILLVAIFNDPLSLTGKVLIIMTASPTAVISNTLALQYNVAPDIVANSTFITTFGSIFTIRLILWLLG